MKTGILIVMALALAPSLGFCRSHSIEDEGQKNNLIAAIKAVFPLQVGKVDCEINNELSQFSTSDILGAADGLLDSSPKVYLDEEAQPLIFMMLIKPRSENGLPWVDVAKLKITTSDDFKTIKAFTYSMTVQVPGQENKGDLRQPNMQTVLTPFNTTANCKVISQALVN